MPASLHLRGPLGRRLDRALEDDVEERPDRAGRVTFADKVRLEPDRTAGSPGQTRAATGGGWNPGGNPDSG